MGAAGLLPRLETCSPADGNEGRTGSVETIQVYEMQKKRKTTVLVMNEMKQSGTPLAWITSYDLPFAHAAEQAGVDMILVGDSGGMVQLGYETTNPVTMDEMITMAKAVRRGAPNTLTVGDMPQGSYEISEQDAVRNALRFIKEAGSDCVKCEGGRRIASKVKAMVDAGVLVIGHLGLTPQSAPSFGGYRVQGKSIDSFEKTLEDALALQEAGACAILLEAMPSEPAGQLAKQLSIPVYGIGAGQHVDGQLVIMHDIMGFYQPFRPWFAKCYIPDVIDEFRKYIAGIGNLREHGRNERKDGLLVLAEMAVRKYIDEVRERKFPGEDYSYPIRKEELEELKKSEKWQKDLS
jgi:3-methyl-2-oxobutanoate hydroxymethyltransferase